MAGNQYNYKYEKHKLFSNDGQRNFLIIRDNILKAVNETGAIMAQYVSLDRTTMSDLLGYLRCPASFFVYACLDRMVEIGELIEWIPESEHTLLKACRVFIKKGVVHNV